jgi:O-antigen/teichoic acid export membrane protein
MQIFKNWLAYIVGRILPAAFAFAGVAIYTRLLDPGSFGIYALLLSTSYAIGLVGYSWLRVAALRMVATASQEAEPSLLATIGLAFGALSLGVSVVIVLVVRIADPSVGWPLTLLAAGCAVISGWYELNITLLQSRLQVLSFGLLQMGRVLVTLLASLVLIMLGWKAAALLAGFFIGNLAAFRRLDLWKPALRGRLDRELLRQFWRFGWPSSASSVGYFSTMFQRFTLEAVGGSALVGVYAAANDFSQQTVGLLMGTATLAGQPLAFRARDNGATAQLSEQMRNNARLVFAVGLPAAAGLVVLAGPISRVYLGPGFHLHAGAVMALAAITMFLSSLRGGYFEQAFEITFKTRAVAVNAFLRVALTVGFSLWLIPRNGVIGAAIALLAAEAIGLVLSVFWARQLMHVPIPLVSLLKIASATGLMVAAVELIAREPTFLGIALAIVAGAVVYAGAIAALHVRGIRAYAGTLLNPGPQTLP